MFDMPLDEGQSLLADGVARYVADHPQADWRGLCDDLGLAAIGVPEEAGGIGGGAVERGLVMAALGPIFLGGDWLAHHAAASLIADADPEHPLLPLLASGAERVAVVTGLSAMASRDGWRFSGRADVVPGAADAHWLLLVTNGAIALIRADAAGVERRARPMLDQTVTADLDLSVAVAASDLIVIGPLAKDLADWLGDAVLTARCAEACGLMQSMLAATVDYVGQRRQFGVAIASFQVLRHRIADMQMALMKAVALTERAIIADAAPAATRAHATSAACVEVAEAAKLVGEAAVQIHGAMGLTEELALGGLYKRGLSVAASLGPVSRHLARHAETAAAA